MTAEEKRKARAERKRLLRDARRRAGLCPYDGRPAEPGVRTCARCREYIRDYEHTPDRVEYRREYETLEHRHAAQMRRQRRRQRKYRAQGLCQCGRERKPGYLQCDGCRYKPVTPPGNLDTGRSDDF